MGRGRERLIVCRLPSQDHLIQNRVVVKVIALRQSGLVEPSLLDLW